MSSWQIRYITDGEITAAQQLRHQMGAIFKTAVQLVQTVNRLSDISEDHTATWGWTRPQVYFRSFQSPFAVASWLWSHLGYQTTHLLEDLVIDAASI